MKKYKANYAVTVMFQLCNDFLITFPGIFIMWLLLNPDNPKGVLFIFPTYGIVILFFIVLGNVIHFISTIFTKYKFFIYDEKIEIKGKKILTQSMSLINVKHIIVDQGSMSRAGNGTPFSITLFNDDYSESLQIKNPSFFLLIYLIKNCKNSKVKFKNHKWYIITFILFTLFATILGLAGRNA